MLQQPLACPASMSHSGCVVVILIGDRGNPLQDPSSPFGVDVPQQSLDTQISALDRLLKIFQDSEKSVRIPMGIPVACFLAIPHSGNHLYIQDLGLLQYASELSGTECGMLRSADPAFAERPVGLCKEA